MSGRSRTLRVEILGDSKGLDKAFGDAGKGADGFSSKLGGLAKTAGIALAGVGVAAGIGAVNAIGAFSDFEGQMNEVFTLLPGISQGAMDDMTGQVKVFSKEFGVLPDEVVPALYQSLSAGVPPDNVFEFLETAQQAAKGGVTDLTTAVDGISSVVNAYGDNISGATEASDLMFTAVRLGKTNFDELSSSLFNVVPTASSLGVQFGDVTAALASMTAQGTPTSVATTQLRQAFVELGDSGTDVAQIFEDAAGKSFKQFIDEGGNTQEAMALLEQAAKDSGVGINELFGSVEAGQAALALTGEGTEAFQRNLAEMQNSSGATELAFDQMQTGLSTATDRIKANLAVLRLEVGERLAPAFAALTEFILNPGIPTLQDIGRVIVEEVVPVLREMGDWFLNVGIPAILTFAGFLQANVLPVLMALGEFITSEVVPRLREFATFIQENMRSVLIGLAGAIVGILIPAFVLWAASATAAAVATIVALAPVIAIVLTLAAVGAALALAWETNFLGMRDHITAFGQATWKIINEQILPALRAIRDTAIDVFNAVRDFIERNGKEIMQILTAVWDQAKLVVESAMSIIRDIIELFASLIRGDWDEVWNEIKSIVSTAKDAIIGTITNLKDVALGIFEILKNEAWPKFLELKDLAIEQLVALATWMATEGGPMLVSKLISGLSNLFSRDTLGGALGQYVKLSEMINTQIAALGTWLINEGGPMLVDKLISGLSTLVSKVETEFGKVKGAVEGAFTNVGQWLFQEGADLVQGLINGIRSKAEGVASAAADIGQAAVDALNPFDDSPWRRTMAEGRDFGSGFAIGIHSTEDEVWRSGSSLGRTAVEGTESELVIPGPHKSEEGYDTGRRFGAGMAMGIEDSEDEVFTHGAALGKSATEGAQHGAALPGTPGAGGDVPPGAGWWQHPHTGWPDDVPPDTPGGGGGTDTRAPTGGGVSAGGGGGGAVQVFSGSQTGLFTHDDRQAGPSRTGAEFRWAFNLVAYRISDTSPPSELIDAMILAMRHDRLVHYTGGQYGPEGSAEPGRWAQAIINRVTLSGGDIGGARSAAQGLAGAAASAGLSLSGGTVNRTGGGFNTGNNITIYVTTRKADAQEIASEAEQAMRYAALSPILANVRR